MKNNLKPKKRSMLRLFAGKNYFIVKRRLTMFFSGMKFAGTFRKELLPYLIFSHSTPLFRKLQGVEHQLQVNKKVNLQIACLKLNGIILQPGETLSYWKLIGKITRKKGYLPGMYLLYGKVISRRGGGLCQLSNLLYWITLHTPLTVTERYRHSYDVFPDSSRTQPFGSGATCVYNYRDLMIYNGTDSTFQLNVMIENDMLKAEWLCDKQSGYRYEVYEKEHCITHEVWGKYIRHNLLHRKKYDLNGNEIDDEFIAENHALMMYEPFIESSSE